MIGKHLIIDVDHIKDVALLETLEGVVPLMMSVIEGCKLNVVKACSYQFTPIGCTALYLLAESHFTIHTFPERGSCCIDLFTCNKDTDFDLALELIYKYFGQCMIIKRTYMR